MDVEAKGGYASACCFSTKLIVPFKIIGHVLSGVV